METGLIVLLLVVTNAVVLVLGGLVTHLTYRAYRRTGGEVLGSLALGFGLLTAGFLVGGGVHQLLGADLVAGVLAQSLLTALGFGFIVYSLYVRTPDPDDTVAA
ncbi:DUF7521 family protein [Halorarius halobius]|uniref:DUF7521 family protein n=1 Tax=Halorarius halobius TaxID=2962671 RepID=UPI0020CE1AAE|nr:hypothetical protein [Halorarius halobius]